LLERYDHYELLIVIDHYLMLFRYDETISKNHNPMITKYQQEHFREPVFSYNPDVIATFKVLLAHMPPNSGTGHLLISPKKPTIKFDLESDMWFKKNVNLGESTLRHFIRDMAAAVELEGDFTNKSGRVTNITRMCSAQVPLHIIASNIGHKNVNNVERYNRINSLKTRAAQALTRPNDTPRDFQHCYNTEVSEWHGANTNKRSSIVVTEITDREDAQNFTREALIGTTHEEVDKFTQPSFIPSNDKPCVFVGSSSTSEPVEPINVPLFAPTPAYLIEEEMRFWSQYNFDNDDIPPPGRVAKAPSGTRLAMQRNLALLRKENAVLNNEISRIKSQVVNMQQ
jgi:hypothetical protein